MLFKSIAAAALASLFLVDGANAAFDLNKKNNAVIYWGQNGAAQINPNKQTDLWTACNNVNVDMVVIGFVTKFKGKAGYPIVNFSNQCGGYLKDPATGKDTDILYCPTIAEHITRCQGIGKKILLSLGGATWTDPGWEWQAHARTSANQTWEMFGKPGPKVPKYRPFGNATVDGFDLDFEHPQNAKNAEFFAGQLKENFKLDPSKRYYLTAAPQCPNPDATLNTCLAKVSFDAIFIQFYNNPCGANTWAKGKSQMGKDSFNMQVWQNWVRSTSMNKSLKLFTGLIAGGVPGSTGYVSYPTAQRIVADSQRFGSYAGVSLWDSSILSINANYLIKVKEALNNPAAFNKRSVVVESVEERDIKTPVGGSSDLSAEEFVEIKAPAESFGKTRRSHRRHHHRR